LSTINGQSSNQGNQANTEINNRQLAELTQHITNLTAQIDKMGGQAEKAAQKLKLDQLAEQLGNLSLQLKNDLNSTSQVLQNLDSEWQKTVQKADLYKQKLSDTVKNGLGKALQGAVALDKNAMKAGFDEAKNAVSGYVDDMASAVKQSFNTLGKAGTAIWDNLKKGAKDVSGLVQGIGKHPQKNDQKTASSKSLQQQNKDQKSELNLAKKTAAQKNKIAESAAKQKTKIVQKEEKKQHKDVLANINNGLSASKNMVGKLSGMFSQYYAARSQAIDIQYDLEKQRILDSTMNEEEKKKALDALDADTQKKRKELAKEQAQTNKTVGIFNAVIDTAQGITAALKAGWPQCIAFAAAAAAQGAVQIALIKSQQIPALASGGIITSKGMALVGEMGPELVTLPEAASVIPLNRPQLNASGVGSFGTANITLQIDGRTLAKQLGTPLRDMIRIKTGLK
jgi:hypothetical protein